jgi:acetyl esterase/lipase
MPLDPQAAALIASLAGGKPVEQMTIEEMRAGLEERSSLTAGEPREVAQVVDSSVPGPDGAIPIRTYVPDGQLPMPGLVYFHGGGWVRGSLQTHDVLCRALANDARCIVVSVDYRMAPEHRFPAAVDDAFAATRWIADNGASLGIDPRHLAVAGDSAGGNLAAAVTQLARAAGGPRPASQVLIYPVTDYNLETPSYLRNAQGYMLTREAMRFYWQQYLGPDGPTSDVRASPLRATDFANLPPALVITAEFDPLLDEGRAYADKLRAAGVPVTYSEYPGMVHGFLTSAGVLDQGRRAIAEMAGALRTAFGAAVAV